MSGCSESGCVCGVFEAQNFRPKVCKTCFHPLASHGGSVGGLDAARERQLSSSSSSATAAAAATAVASPPQEQKQVDVAPEPEPQPEPEPEPQPEPEPEPAPEPEPEPEPQPEQQPDEPATVTKSDSFADVEEQMRREVEEEEKREREEQQRQQQQQQQQQPVAVEAVGDLPVVSTRMRSGTMTGIGFKDATSDELSRHLMKEGFQMGILLAGPSNVGKKTFARCLMKQYSKDGGALFVGGASDENRSANAPAPAAASIHETVLHVDESGFRGDVTVSITADFDQVPTEQATDPIVAYVTAKLDKYLADSLEDVTVKDQRVHCCLYFVAPLQTGLSALDVHALTALQKYVNIIPVIAKRDLLTPAELAKLVETVRAQMAEHGIKPFVFPGTSQEVWSVVASVDDADDTATRQAHLAREILANLKKLNTVPAATAAKIEQACKGLLDQVGGGDGVAEVKVKGRHLIAATVDAEDDDHSDLVRLRENLLLTHRLHLCKVTHEHLYHPYRQSKLQGMLKSGDKASVAAASAELDKIKKAQAEAEAALNAEKKRMQDEVADAQKKAQTFSSDNEALKRQLAEMEQRLAAAAISSSTDKKKK